MVTPDRPLAQVLGVYMNVRVLLNVESFWIPRLLVIHILCSMVVNCQIFRGTRYERGENEGK